jgi:hypothetical protein
MKVGIPVPPIVDVAKVEREVRHRVVADDDECESAEEREGSDRHRERWQPDRRDEDAVERAAE